MFNLCWSSSWMYWYLIEKLLIEFIDVIVHLNSSITICDALRDLVPRVQFKKNMKSTNGVVILLVKWQASVCNFSNKIIIPPWVFFTFFKLRKWYQIVQSITYFILMRGKAANNNHNCEKLSNILIVSTQYVSKWGGFLCRSNTASTFIWYWKPEWFYMRRQFRFQAWDCQNVSKAISTMPILNCRAQYFQFNFKRTQVFTMWLPKFRPCLF